MRVDGALQRMLTRAFIDVDPVYLRLVPYSEEATPSGGVRRVEGQPRRAALFTLVEPSDSGYRSPVRTEQGESDRPDYMLVGEVGTLVEQDDRFEHGGHEFVVTVVMPDNGYEVRAMAVRVV